MNMTTYKQIGRAHAAAYKRVLSCLGKTVNVTVMRIYCFNVIFQENNVLKTHGPIYTIHGLYDIK